MEQIKRGEVDLRRPPPPPTPEQIDLTGDDATKAPHDHLPQPAPQDRVEDTEAVAAPRDSVKHAVDDKTEARAASARQVEKDAAQNAHEIYVAARGGPPPYVETPADRAAAAEAAHRDTMRRVWQAERMAGRAQARAETDPSNLAKEIVARGKEGELDEAQRAEWDARLRASDAQEAAHGGPPPEPPTMPPQSHDTLGGQSKTPSPSGQKPAPPPDTLDETDSRLRAVKRSDDGRIETDHR